MTQPSPEEAEVLVQRACELYSNALDQLLVMMRNCPFTEREERWGAAVGLLETFLKGELSAVLFAAAALERLSRVPVESPE